MISHIILSKPVFQSHLLFLQGKNLRILKLIVDRLYRMVLPPGHWIMLSDCLSNDDLKVKHLTMANIHLDDANVKEYCKVGEYRKNTIHNVGNVTCSGHLTCRECSPVRAGSLRPLQYLLQLPRHGHRGLDMPQGAVQKNISQVWIRNSETDQL